MLPDTKPIRTLLTVVTPAGSVIQMFSGDWRLVSSVVVPLNSVAPFKAVTVP